MRSNLWHPDQPPQAACSIFALVFALPVPPPPSTVKLTSGNKGMLDESSDIANGPALPVVRSILLSPGPEHVVTPSR